jgi:hypothetical protein
MTQPTIAQLHNLTDRAGAGLTADEQARLRDGIDQLEALQAVARGYCPACGRGDAGPTVEDWERERQRADEAERRLRNIANGHPRADSIQAEIGEMIAQTHELRDQLRAAETALARQAQEMATWRATANTLDAGGPGTPRSRAEQAEQQRDQLAALVRDFLDPDPCQLDHHSYCQAHSWMCSGSSCPHARAREVLAALDEEQPASTSWPTREVHVAIRHADEYTANRAALSLIDWINAEFPGHHVTTDAREWDEPIVTVHAAPNLSPEAAEALDALVGVAKRQIAEDAAAVPDGTDTTEPAWTPPPPGDTREQLPDHLLDLIRGSIPDYTSTACVTAYTLAVAVHWSHPRRAELGQWAERMHARCRINQKFTGQLCACGCHQPGPA